MSNAQIGIIIYIILILAAMLGSKIGDTNYRGYPTYEEYIAHRDDE